MIRVGFIGNAARSWMGGWNYYKNLLYAIREFQKGAIEPVVFLGRKGDREQRELFRERAEVIEDPLLDPWTPGWFAGRVLHRGLGSQRLLESMLGRHGIDVLSHSRVVDLRGCRTVNWIVDFQHVHLPHMFTREEIGRRNADFMRYAEKGDAVVVSSEDALRDFERFAPRFAHKGRVLRFVSQPIPGYAALGAEDEARVRGKYGIEGPFFYLPNQFWAHKNHRVAFEAVRLLKRRGRPLGLVCSGHLEDHRNRDYLGGLLHFLERNDLKESIRLTGLVPYEDVFALIRFSTAVLNPSLFEGWSSTVEECKSVGKPMILSDIEVHKEQYPEAVFFDRQDPEALAEALGKADTGLFRDRFEESAALLTERTRAFAQAYGRIVSECRGAGRGV